MLEKEQRGGASSRTSGTIQQSSPLGQLWVRFVFGVPVALEVLSSAPGSAPKVRQCMWVSTDAVGLLYHGPGSCEMRTVASHRPHPGHEEAALIANKLEGAHRRLRLPACVPHLPGVSM